MRKTVWIAGLVVAVAAGGAVAETIVFREGLNGYSGTDDMYLLRAHNGEVIGTGTTLRNNGGRDFIEVYTYRNAGDWYAHRHGLIRFRDLFGDGANQVPADAANNAIISAALRLNVSYKAVAGNSVLWVWQMVGDWTEGSGNGSAPEDGASCYAYRAYDSGGNHQYWGNETSAAKGPRNDVDLIRPVFGSQEMYQASPIPGAGNWLEIDVTPTAQRWQEGTLVNSGFFLEHNPPRAQIEGLDFRSSEYAADPTLRPELVIEYVPEPATMGLLLAGGLLTALRRRK